MSSGSISIFTYRLIFIAALKVTLLSSSFYEGVFQWVGLARINESIETEGLSLNCWWYHQSSNKFSSMDGRQGGGKGGHGCLWVNCQHYH